MLECLDRPELIALIGTERAEKMGRDTLIMTILDNGWNEACDIAALKLLQSVNHTVRSKS